MSDLKTACALQFTNTHASWGNEDVVIGATLAVRPGEVCAVLGANGAGKTSLLRSVMGLMPRVSGSIKGPGGVELTRRPTHTIAGQGVGFVPEGRGILYSLTVRENLLLGMTAARHLAPAQAAANLDRELTRFPALRERLAHRAGVLSGGQQQMLAIARALIGDPRVLLLDEPSLGLAPLIRQEIAAVLVRLKTEQHLAILLVEQDVNLVGRCADHGYVMRRGRLTGRLGQSELADRERLRQLYLFDDAVATS